MFRDPSIVEIGRSLLFFFCSTAPQVRRSPCRWDDDGKGEPGWESVLASFSLVSLCNLSQVSPRALAK